MTKRKKQKSWVYSPAKQSKPKVPDTVKTEVQTKANELVETVLKPEHIKPPPEDEQFNYIVSNSRYARLPPSNSPQRGENRL